MSSVLELLSRHHKVCDEILGHVSDAVVRRDWSTAAAGFADFQAQLERHIRVEEDDLFPAFERATGSMHGPTHVMRAEHLRIVELVAALRDAIRAEAQERYALTHAEFETLMRAHDAKEENVLYPACDRILREALPAVLARIVRIVAPN